MTDFDKFNEAFWYDPATGGVFWKKPACPRIKPNDEAGCFNREGYRRINFCGKTYLAHRIAWLLTHKVWPANEIDHINRIRSDNRIENLRDVTRSENARNRDFRAPGQMRHGGHGITKHKGKWQVQVHSWRDKRPIYGGLFPCFAKAVEKATLMRREFDL